MQNLLRHYASFVNSQGRGFGATIWIRAEFNHKVDINGIVLRVSSVSTKLGRIDEDVRGFR